MNFRNHIVVFTISLYVSSLICSNTKSVTALLELSILLYIQKNVYLYSGFTPVISTYYGPEYLAIKKLLKQLFLIAKWVIADQYTVFNLNAVRRNT